MKTAVLKFLSIFNIERLKEPIMILMLAGIAGGVWSFIELAENISENHTKAFDRAILLAMRDPVNTSDPLGPPWMEETVRDVTALGGVTILSMITFAVICYLCLQGKTRMAFVVFISIAGGMIFSIILKEMFGRARPDVITHLYYASNYSFPSGHSMMAASTYLTLGVLIARSQPNRLLKVYFISIAVILTVLIGISRVYIGVHWPSDVLGGWAAGAVWALLWWFIAFWLQLLGKVEKPTGKKGTQPLNK
jgi:undecaprenyl-diphosphatase